MTHTAKKRRKAGTANHENGPQSSDTGLSIIHGVSRAYGDVVHSVRERPLTSVAIAVGVGAVASIVLCRAKPGA